MDRVYGDISLKKTTIYNIFDKYKGGKNHWSKANWIQQKKILNFGEYPVFS